MEGPPRELGKCLKKDSDKRLDVPRSIFSGLYDLPVIRVREADSNPTGILAPAAVT